MRKRLPALIVGVLLAASLAPAVAWSSSPEDPGLVAGQGDLTQETAISIVDAVIGDIPAQTYAGQPIEPEPVVMLGETPLVKDEDYSVSYENNIAVGEATVVVTGMGAYEGSISRVFRISPAEIISVALSTEKYTYNGTVRSPKVLVKFGAQKLAEGSDYKLSTPAGRKNCGKYTYKVTGIGNFVGTKTVALTIAQAGISKASAAKIGAKVYNTKAQKPLPTLKFAGKKLKNKTDYKLSYSKNVKKGTAVIKVKGAGNFKGSKRVTFQIKAASLSKLARVSGLKSKTYNGSQQTQNPVIKLGKNKLKRGTDYVVSYKNNVNAGTATMIMKGKGSCSGSVSKTFKIAPRSLSAASVGSIRNYAHTGWANEPDPSVRLGGKRLVRNVDYWLSYRNNVRPGTATVVVHGMGNYCGSTGESFWIYGIYITKTGDCYHRDGCSSLSRSRIPITLGDAQARGYRPCHRCRP